MSVAVTIAGIDRTKWIAWESLRIDNILTTQVDKCSFKIRNYGSHIFMPNVGAEVVITDDGVKVFAGYIVRRDQTAKDYKVLEYSCECTDYTRLLQKLMVVETYENMTIAAIIQAIVAKYAPYGINTTTYVACDKVLASITFNYVPVQQCLERLAEIVGYDWFIDYDKNIWFKAASTISAPYSLTDSNGNYIFNSLRIRKDNSQVRNTIIVRGGNYYGDRRRDKILCNGTDFQFPLPYKYRDFHASLTGQALSLGIDFSSDPDDYDALYNYSEKVLRFKESDIPSNGATLSFEGEPLIPVIVKVKNPAAISAMYSAEGVAGDYEYEIQDKSINSKEEARDRAAAELLAYAESLEEGEFNTEVAGLRAGQQISINSDAHSINENYIIKQVTSRMLTPSEMQYKVTLISTKTIDMIGILQRLLAGRSADVGFDLNEVLDKITSFFENIEITESVVSYLVHLPQTETISITEENDPKPINYPVKFVIGPWTPISIDSVLTGCSGRWKMIEGTGDTINDSIGTNHGTKSGPTWDAEGIIGYCLNCPNTTDKIDLPSSYSLSGAFSICFWGYIDDLDDTRSICCNQTSFTNGRVSFLANSGGVSRIEVRTPSGTTNISLTETIPESEWSHIVITRDGSNNLKVYRNGTDVTSGTPSQAGTITLNRILGRPNDSSYESFRDKMQDFRVYNGTVLSQANAQTLYDHLKRQFVLDGSRLG